MELTNKKVLVYGTGISGISAYKFLLGKGANVFMYADRKPENNEINNFIDNFNKVLEIKFDYVILSPGVTIIGNKNINKLKKTGALILSELELGYLFCKGKFIAVTGTNGKTTCVCLLNHILKSKYKTFLCGNVGTPITSIADLTSDDCIVIAEVSSFMLEIISPNFKPDVALLLNITPDHISRHKTFDAYVKAKMEITRYQNKNDYLLIPDELKNVETEAQKIIIYSKNYKSNLVGDFNNLNIAFCEKVTQIFEISSKNFKKSLKTFTPVPYRIEKLGKKRGITYINDSKSTNPDSCVKAIRAMKKPAVVLLGGSDKGNTFTEIFKNFNNIKLAIIYGQTADILESDALSCGFTKIAKFENLHMALSHLNEFVKRGDVVLFSPACASYDEFKHYMERGAFFSKYFDEL